MSDETECTDLGSAFPEENTHPLFREGATVASEPLRASAEQHRKVVAHLMEFCGYSQTVAEFVATEAWAAVAPLVYDAALDARTPIEDRGGAAERADVVAAARREAKEWAEICRQETGTPDEIPARRHAMALYAFAAAVERGDHVGAAAPIQTPTETETNATKGDRE